MIFLSTVGIAIIFGYIIYRIYLKNKVVSFLILFSILVIYSFIIIPRNKVWANEKYFFEQMVIDSPNSVQARNGLAQGYFKLGQLNDSYVQAQAGYTIYQKHEPLINLLGKLEFIKGDYNKSLEYFTEAIKLNNNRFENHQFYSYSLTKLGRYNNSIRYIEDQFRKHPDDNELRFIMAVNLYRMGNKKEALSDKYKWTNKLNLIERERTLTEF